jgi:WhiB family redox-sensing transcriptional regulator
VASHPADSMPLSRPESLAVDSVDSPLRVSVMGDNDQIWRSKAACKGAAPGLFFPDVHERGYRAALAEAKAVCASCPVSDPCQAWAIAHPCEVGVWGGLTEAARRSLRKRIRSQQ